MRGITAVTVSVILFLALACTACPEIAMVHESCHSEGHDSSSADTCLNNDVVVLKKTFDDVLPPAINAVEWMLHPSVVPVIEFTPKIQLSENFAHSDVLRL